MFKNTESYNKLFAVLAEHTAFSEGIPSTLVCDFEKSLILAANNHLPWVEVGTNPVLSFIYKIPNIIVNRKKPRFVG